jgi:UDP-3-O-[3-hydroxymyristoyl] glucosamine N-acyltransferase
MVDERFYTRTSVNNLRDLFNISVIKALITGISHISEAQLELPIDSIAVLNEAQKGQIAFFDNAKYKQDFLESKAEFCIAHHRYLSLIGNELSKDKILIPSHDPYRLYALVAEALYCDTSILPSEMSEYTQDKYGAKVHKSACLEENVQTAYGVVIEAGVHIGKNTIIKANTVIGTGCYIGRECFIDTNVSISHSLVGDKVVLLAGAKIGQDGFGFAMGATHIRVPQLGRVIIQDKVTIGANSCVDRGTIKDTIIGEGSCIDNMVQIAHNVIIGLHCVIAGNSSIAGSVIFEDYVVCGGHTCIAGHLTIHTQAKISGGSGVMRDVPARMTVTGSPAMEIKEFFKMIAVTKKLAKKETPDDRKN